MRLVLVTVAVVLAHATGAAANCASHRGTDVAHQQKLVPVLNQGARELPEAVAAAQFAGTGIDNVAPGWYVGVAPGPLSLDDVRAEIGRRIDAQYEPGDAAYLKERLLVDAELYPEVELRAIQAEIVKRVMPDFGMSAAAGCTRSDNLRVEVELFSDSTEAQRAEVAAVVAEYGDRALLHINEFGPPVLWSGPGSTPIFVVDFVRRRCRDGLELRVRNRVRSLVRRVTVAGRKLPLKGVVRLPADRRPRVKVVLRNGRSARSRIGCP